MFRLKKKTILCIQSPNRIKTVRISFALHITIQQDQDLEAMNIIYYQEAID